MHKEIRRQAIDWFVRARARSSERADGDACIAWRRARHEHDAAYVELEDLYARSLELRGDAAIRAVVSNALQRRRDRFPAVAWRSAFFAASAAAALVVLALFAGFDPQQLFKGEEKRYATVIGEQRSVILDDGSTILIDSASAVRTRVDGSGRHAVVERGQVQFQIVHDPKRPFEVEVGSAKIHDIGTLFQTRLDDDRVLVTLIEGAVSVSSSDAVDVGSSTAPGGRTLTPGQQLSVDSGGRLGSVRNIDLKLAHAWTEGELIFEQRPLGELLKEMNRYTRTRILLFDPALQSIPVSGVFHQGDQQSLLLALQAGWSLQAKRNAENDIVLYREHK